MSNTFIYISLPGARGCCSALSTPLPAPLLLTYFHFLGHFNYWVFPYGGRGLEPHFVTSSRSDTRKWDDEGDTGQMAKTQ